MGLSTAPISVAGDLGGLRLGIIVWITPEVVSWPFLVSVARPSASL